MTKHLTDIANLADQDIFNILQQALYYDRRLDQGAILPQPLAGQIIVNLFFENSTRTSCSFEIAAKRLGAEIATLNIATSSVNKGEDFADTIRTLGAMRPNSMIVRHQLPNAAKHVADILAAANMPVSVVNAGDGVRAHPTQALLDAATILKAMDRDVTQGLKGLKIAICGDIKHSRVAGSNAVLMTRMGADLRFVGPKQFMPEKSENDVLGSIPQFSSLEEGLKDCDIVMGLRIQKERIQQGTSLDTEGFHRSYGLTHGTMRYAKENALFMHPGPMNRGIEVDGKLADDPKVSLVTKQVTMGVSTRMAILEYVSGQL